MRIVFTALVHAFSANVVETISERPSGKKVSSLVDSAQAHSERDDDECDDHSSGSELDPDSSDQPLPIAPMDTDSVEGEPEAGAAKSDDEAAAGEDRSNAIDVDVDEEDEALPGVEDVAAMFSSVGERALERREKAHRREQLQLFRRRVVGLLQSTLRYTLNGELLGAALQAAVWLACKLRGTATATASGEQREDNASASLVRSARSGARRSRRTRRAQSERVGARESPRGAAECCSYRCSRRTRASGTGERRGRTGGRRCRRAPRARDSGVDRSRPRAPLPRRLPASNRYSHSVSARQQRC